MSFGSNLQYLRRLRRDMTQEALAEKLNVSRQTISKWEVDAAQPEMDKAIVLCGIFNCTLDNLFREEMQARSTAYSNLRVEEIGAFRYVAYTVISTDPETDAIGRVRRIAKENGVDPARVIGWDFPNLSGEQINVCKMHGYTAAWILPDGKPSVGNPSVGNPSVGLTPEGLEIRSQPAHKYAAIHIERPFDNPFVTIPGAYQTLTDYMRVNGLEQAAEGVIPCFETDGETMDVCIACR